MFTNYKLVVFVPLTHADQVRAVVAGAGVGNIGHYMRVYCSALRMLGHIQQAKEYEN